MYVYIYVYIYIYIYIYIYMYICVCIHRLDGELISTLWICSHHRHGGQIDLKFGGKHKFVIIGQHIKFH